jgi:hypothetical protein
MPPTGLALGAVGFSFIGDRVRHLIEQGNEIIEGGYVRGSDSELAARKNREVYPSAPEEDDLPAPRISGVIEGDTHGVGIATSLSVMMQAPRPAFGGITPPHGPDPQLVACPCLAKIRDRLGCLV